MMEYVLWVWVGRSLGAILVSLKCNVLMKQSLHLKAVSCSHLAGGRNLSTGMDYV